MKRLQIAQFIALGATAVSIVGAVLGRTSGDDLGITVMAVGFLIGLISYIFGGFGTALRMAGKIAKVGWVIAPFPFDIVTFLIVLPFAIVIFVCFPIIPVRKAYKEKVKTELGE